VRCLDDTGAGWVCHEGVGLQEELTREVDLARLTALLGQEVVRGDAVHLGKLRGVIGEALLIVIT
jgi:hypothetical protein